MTHLIVKAFYKGTEIKGLDVYGVVYGPPGPLQRVVQSLGKTPLDYVGNVRMNPYLGVNLVAEGSMSASIAFPGSSSAEVVWVAGGLYCNLMPKPDPQEFHINVNITPSHPTTPTPSPTRPPQALSFQPELLYPSWVVIDNGYPTDKQTSQKIVEYLSKKFPPAYAVRKEVPKGQEPDPLDLWLSCIIAVGGPSANPWIRKFNVLMDPRWEENDGSVDFEEPRSDPLKLVKKEPLAYVNVAEGATERCCIISSWTWQWVPWLKIFMVAGYSANDTVEAGDLFCKGETRGIWVNGVKKADC